MRQSDTRYIGRRADKFIPASGRSVGRTRSLHKVITSVGSPYSRKKANHTICVFRLAQQDLSEQLDNLTAQLRSIEDIQQTSPKFDSYVRKLINIKHKVTVVFSVLQGAQDRLNKIHKQIEREKLKRRSILDSDLNSPSAS